MIPNPHSLPRRAKRLMYLSMDGALVPFSLYVAHALRYGTLTPPIQGGLPYFMLLMGLGLILPALN